MDKFPGSLQQPEPGSPSPVNSAADPEDEACVSSTTAPDDPRSFLPRFLTLRLARECLRELAPEEERRAGAILFADISGFTGLTERLGERGPEGAERVAEYLNWCFGTVLDVIYAHGGEVLRFAGDAVIALWPCSGEALPASTLHASSCALEAQNALTVMRFGEEQLQLRIGISAGEIWTGQLGGIQGRWQLLVAGQPLAEAGLAANQARPGEVIATEAASRFIPEAKSDSVHPGFVRLLRCEARALAPAPEADQLPLLTLDQAAPFIPRSILERIAEGQAEWLKEFRRLTVLFASLEGLDSREATALSRFQEVTVALQEAVYRYDGSINYYAVDDKGTTLMAVWGLPGRAHEDDPQRALCVAIRLQQRMHELGVRCGVGVTTGRAFCGTVGGARRRDYTIVGKVVNLAARLMQATVGGILCDLSTATSAGTGFDFEAEAPLHVRGFSEPVTARKLLGAAAADRADAGAMVGRSSERERLLAALTALRDVGRSGAVILEGEAGLGKSILIRSLVREAERLNVRVVVGEAEAVECTTPYYVWRDVYRHLLEGSEGEPAVRERLKGDDRLSALLPLLSVVLPLNMPDNDATAQLAGQVRAENTLRILSYLLQQDASLGPLVIVLDDGHWMDSLSWALAAQVVREVRPLLMVVAARPMEDLPPGYESLLRREETVRLRLQSLSEADMGALIEHRLGVEAPPAELVAFIGERTGGNPFYSEQLLLSLLDAGHLTVEGSRCRIASGVTRLDALGVPESMEGVILARFDRLSAAQQLALKVASVIGRIFLFLVLNEVYPVTTQRRQLLAQMHDLCRRELIAVAEAHPHLAFAFQHVVLQQVAYNLMSFQQRRELHRAVAERLEALYSGELDPWVPLLAYHWTQAGDAEKAIDYLEWAARQALENYANTEVVRFVNEALRLAEELPTITSRRRALWHRWLGTAHLNLAHYEASVRQFDRGLSLLGWKTPRGIAGTVADLLGQVACQGLHRLQPARFVGRSTENYEVLEAARMYQQRCEEAYWNSDVLRLVQGAARTLNMAERAGRSEELAVAYATTSLITSVSGLTRQAHFYAGLARRSADQVQHVPTLAYTYLILTVFQQGIGYWEGIEADIHRATRLYEQIGDRPRWFECLGTHGMYLLHSGRWSALRELLGRYEAAVKPSDSIQARVWLRSLQLRLAIASGELDPAVIERIEELLLEEMAAAERILALGVLALARLERGETGLALAAAREQLELTGKRSPTTFYGLHGYAGTAETLVRLAGATDESGDPKLWAEAQAAIRALRRFAQLFPIGRPVLALIEGYAHAGELRHRRAVHAWRRSLEIAHRDAMPFEAGRASLALARTGATSEEERRSLLAWAGATFTVLGAGAHLRELQNPTKEHWR